MATPPGLYFKSRAPETPPDPLRSDVAGFIGRTRRGPLRDEEAPERAAVVRCEGWRRYLLLFGDLIHEAAMPYAVHGFFNNGGLVAHVVRVGHGGAVATADWDVGAGLDNRAYLWNSGQTTGWSTTLPSGSARAVLRPVFTSLRYRIEAASPGTWGNQVTVTATFERQGPDGLPRVQLVVRAPDEYPEFLRDLAPYRTPEQEAAGFGPTMANQVKAESNLIRLVPLDDADTPPVEPRNTSAAVNALIAPAVALPDLYTDLADGDDALQVLQAAAALAAATQDRLVLADVPADKQAVRCAVAYAARLRNCLGIDGSLRATVVYHPWLCVVDPYGPPGQPFRAVPPSGHVAGVIARIDRERGPHHTTANVPVFQATDVAATYSADDAGQLNDAGTSPTNRRSWPRPTPPTCRRHREAAPVAPT